MAKAAAVVLVMLYVVGAAGCRDGEPVNRGEHGFTALFPVSIPAQVMSEAVRRCGALPGVGRVIDRTGDRNPEVNVGYGSRASGAQKELLQECFRDAGAQIAIGG